MESEVTVVYADREPMPGVVLPGTHQLYRNPRLAIEKRTLNLLHSDDIRVQMCYAGICGTDLHIAEKNPETGYVRCSAPAHIPKEGRILGHEGIGKIIAKGADVLHVDIGDYVCFESIIVCHHCDRCRSGRFNQCRHARLLGLEKDGLFGTVVDVPGRVAHKVTTAIRHEDDVKALACVEPAGVAYVACQNAHVSAGDTVVVFGAGPIGLFCALLSLTVFGASRVSIVEPVPFRRQVAAKYSDHVYSLQEFFSSPPSDIDVVIEASGNLENVSSIFRNLNANGRVVLLARSGSQLMLNAIDHMITNQITIVGSRGHLGGAFNDILNLYRNGRIQLDAVITEVIHGNAELVSTLRENEKVLHDNCKVLVGF